MLGSSPRGQQRCSTSALVGRDFSIHMYGVMLLLAIFAAVWLTGVRWNGSRRFRPVVRVTVWGVAFGVIGARPTTDITRWSEVPSRVEGRFEVWQGGLGVWGGILLGTIAGAGRGQALG